MTSSFQHRIRLKIESVALEILVKIIDAIKYLLDVGNSLINSLIYVAKSGESIERCGDVEDVENISLEEIDTSGSEKGGNMLGTRDDIEKDYIFLVSGNYKKNDVGK
jgi:hypothetical protein